MSEQNQPPEMKSVHLPKSRYALVLGVDAEGRLYHEVIGGPGLIEVAGLIAFGKYISELGFDAATRMSPTPAEQS